MSTPWCDALRAAAICALDPVAVGGVLLRGPPGPARERWLGALQALLPAPARKVPAHVDDTRLLGGLDLVATLQRGQPVVQRGLLAEADGGVLLLAMAERIGTALAARLASVIDTGQVQLERDGVGLVQCARLGFVALDEGIDGDERVPAALAERLAIHIQLDAADGAAGVPPVDIAAARARLAAIEADDALLQAFCAAASAFGIGSLRAPLMAVRVARAAAACAGRGEIGRDDAELAARLVLAPRARAAPPAQACEPPANDDAAPNERDAPAREETAVERALPERVLEAVLSALPPGTLAQLQAGATPRSAPAPSGRSGASMPSARRGRPIGSERGEPRGGARLDLLATLRAAAPWQALRRRESGRAGLQVRRGDLHVRRQRDKRETTTIFAVDASGSAALHRLGEAKGAVELLLADCYVRRDKVALLAFRGESAELLLPPTRSLPRAKRCLADLPGGGGTPLAAGIAAAQVLADGLARRGGSPALVLLTDGRANVARDGSPGRAAARDDALKAARAWRAAGLDALLLDTSPQPQASAREVADAMGARYLALPHADAAQMSCAVAAVKR